MQELNHNHIKHLDGHAPEYHDYHAVRESGVILIIPLCDSKWGTMCVYVTLCHNLVEIKLNVYNI